MCDVYNNNKPVALVRRIRHTYIFFIGRKSLKAERVS